MFSDIPTQKSNLIILRKSNGTSRACSTRRCVPSTVKPAVHATHELRNKIIRSLTRRKLPRGRAAQKRFRHLRHRVYFSVNQTLPGHKACSTGRRAPSSVAPAVHATHDALRKASVRLPRQLPRDLAGQACFRYLRHRFCFFSVNQTAPSMLHSTLCRNRQYMQLTTNLRIK